MALLGLEGALKHYYYYLSQRSTPSQTGRQHEGTYHTLLTASTAAGSAEAGQPSTTHGIKHHQHATAPSPFEQTQALNAPARTTLRHTDRHSHAPCASQPHKANRVGHAMAHMQCCTCIRSHSMLASLQQVIRKPVQPVRPVQPEGLGQP
jgi:hypothetical protein